MDSFNFSDCTTSIPRTPSPPPTANRSIKTLSLPVIYNWLFLPNITMVFLSKQLQNSLELTKSVFTEQFDVAILHRPNRKVLNQLYLIYGVQIDRIIAYISSSKQTRRMTYTQVCKQLQLPISSSALDRALRTRGHHRRVDVVEMENDSLGRKSRSSASVDGPANGLSLSSAIVKASAASDEIFRDKSMPERY